MSVSAAESYFSFITSGDYFGLAFELWVQVLKSNYFPVDIEYRSIDFFFDGLFYLIQTLGDFLRRGTEGSDGPGGAVEGVVVGGFADRQIGFAAPDGFHGGEGFAFGFEVFTAVELEVQGEDAYVRGNILVLLWGFAFF